MEADWEFEIGGDAPVIDAHWNGFVDLRADPARAAELTECSQLPGLGDALARLNGAASPVWTSKADVFAPDPIDPDELEAASECARAALACYIDVLARDEQQWKDRGAVESACRRMCDLLHAWNLDRCRADLVVRQAFLGPDREGLGVTVYATACGTDTDGAKARLVECLDALVRVLVPE
jgi:hypothetical protein